jgi:hypothetical protein
VWKLRHGVALVRQLRCYGESPACWSARRAGSTGLVPEPAGPGNAGGRLRPLGLDAPATPPGRRPGPAGAPAVIGLVAAPSAATAPHHAEHQHDNDHDDQHPQPCRHGSLLGRRRSRSS